MMSKLNRIYIYYLVIIVLALAVTYLRFKTQELKQTIVILEKKLDSKMFYDNHLLGNKINTALLYSLTEGNTTTINMKEGLVLYGNNKGCNKCTEVIIALYKLNFKKKNLLVVFNNNFITEFESVREYVLKYNNILWDKFNSLDSLLNLDLRKVAPLLLYIKEGVIVSYCFIVDDNKDIVERYFNRI